MRRCAFLTMDSLDGFVTYDTDAVEPLRQRGWHVDAVPWRAAADWGRYEAVVIRSPWDYADDPDAFLDVLAAIDASSARLENGLDVVRWNLRKTYLRELDAVGVPIVPTRWLSAPTAERLAAAVGAVGAEAVVKPVVGANADRTFRLAPDAAAERFAAAASALAGRDVMVQPFVESVVQEGEFSVFAFGGAVSHAILKTPARGDFRVQEEHGGHIQGVEPEPALRDAADRALGAIAERFGGPLLYARVDLVRIGGGFALMEAELIEPSLYFPFAPGSATRFADAFAARLG